MSNKGIYRVVQTSFWSDQKVQEDMTPEDRYMFLYLLTNEKTNLCGCYELGMKKVSFETGYDLQACKKIIARLVDMELIKYNEQTSEVLILNWAKNNWSTSDKYLNGVEKCIDEVKYAPFKQYLYEIIEEYRV